MPSIRTRDGHDLFVRVLGRGSPCLLVHGFASSSRSWLPFVAPLLHRHRFILPDLRGFGHSHRVPLPEPCPLTVYAHDLEDVLDALRIRELPVVGISMGAFTTLQSFRLFGGKRFNRYLHVDQGPIVHNRDDYPFGMLGAGQPAFFERLRALLTALDDERMQQRYDDLPPELRAEFWGVLGEFSAAAVTTEGARALVRTLARQEPLMRRLLPVERWQVYVQIARAYLERNYDLRDAFRNIAVPMTVLIGGASRMYPPAGQHTIKELAPHARIRELPNVGHHVPFEAPRLFLRELRDFLAAA
ncbi:MAG TPA: alpha/beta hydrolase [Polyangiaceae bacterium]|nr:alpha/beta hydrolase [Polyangiaceae bacterium]